MFWIALALFLLRCRAGPAHVVFIVDGAPDWDIILAMLPAPNASFMMTPVPVGSPESAAMASTMSTGCVSRRRAVSMVGTPLASRASKTASLALVTNACATDPTVASFFVSAPDRYDATGIAASVRALNLRVNLGGASRLFLPPGVAGDPCFPTNKTQLTAARCAPDRPLTGSFGDARAALAAECFPIQFGSSDQPTLNDMVLAAMTRLEASAKTTPLFMVVGSDRMDKFAHSGDNEACSAEAADVANSVQTALSLLSRREDWLVVVTGDHVTLRNSTIHASAPVPVLVYGPETAAAVARVGLESPMPATKFPLFFYPTATPCKYTLD